MFARRNLLLALCVTTMSVNVAAREVIMEAGIGAHYYPYYPWLGCSLPYRCGDPVQMRMELRRERRLQELRERATPSEERGYASGEGPWGRQRYQPPATREANIQPAYRGASQLRQEYQQSGKPIGESATKSP